jgi:hypothetical protein
MNGKIDAWWLNALIKTATVLMWLSILGAVISGLAIGISAASAGNSNTPANTSYNEPTPAITTSSSNPNVEKYDDGSCFDNKTHKVYQVCPY